MRGFRYKEACWFRLQRYRRLDAREGHDNISDTALLE